MDLTYNEWDSFKYIHEKLERKTDYRYAQICYILAEVNRGNKGKPYKIEDFMPQYKTHKKDLIAEVMKFKGMLSTWYG